MFPVDEQTLVLLAGVTLAAFSALVLIWRVMVRSSARDSSAEIPTQEAQAVLIPLSRPEPIKVQQPAATVPVMEAAKSNSADDPYGVMATLPAGASYTAIAVATAEAAARVKATSGSMSRT